jgi:hypothetical protein
MKQGIVMSEIQMLSIVATLEDLPEEGLIRGQVGTVVDSWLLTSLTSNSAMIAARRTPWQH